MTGDGGGGSTVLRANSLPTQAARPDFVATRSANEPVPTSD